MENRRGSQGNIGLVLKLEKPINSYQDHPPHLNLFRFGLGLLDKYVRTLSKLVN